MGSKTNPKKTKTAKPGHRHIRTEVAKKLLVPRCLQDGSRWPRVAQDSLKLAQKGSQDSPKMGQVGPRWTKIAPKLLQQSPKIAQDGQRCPKMVPRWPRHGPRWCKMSVSSCFGLSSWAVLALPGFTFALPLLCPRFVFAMPSLCFCFAAALPLLSFCFCFAFALPFLPDWGVFLKL